MILVILLENRQELRGLILRIHCPRCGKLYLVDTVDGVIPQEAHFICTVCRHEFSRYSGFSALHEPEVDPRSDDQNLEKKHHTPSVVHDSLPRRMKEAWQEVLEHFEDSESHQRFIQLSRSLGQLEFAEDRYRRLSEVIGEDSEVEKRIRQLEVLRLEQKLTSSFTIGSVAGRPLNPWIVFSYSVGGLCFFLGLLFPELRYVSLAGALIIGGLLLNGLKK